MLKSINGSFIALGLIVYLFLENVFLRVDYKIIERRYDVAEQRAKLLSDQILDFHLQGTYQDGLRDGIMRGQGAYSDGYKDGYHLATEDVK